MHNHRLNLVSDVFHPSGILLLGNIFYHQHVGATWFLIANNGDDLESVHEAIGDLAGSTATKRNRAKQIPKIPEKFVSWSCYYLDIQFM